MTRLAAVVHGLGSVHELQGTPPVVIGGLAVLCRLVDVLEVRDVDLEPPADDLGNRLHATSHAWAHDTASTLTIEVVRTGGTAIEATTLVAEPGPLVAMEVQAVMNRPTAEQGTDLLDIVRLTTDRVSGPMALRQLSAADTQLAQDVARHVELWFVEHRRRSLRWIGATGVGSDVVEDDLALVAELLHEASGRPRPT